MEDNKNDRNENRQYRPHNRDNRDRNPRFRHHREGGGNHSHQGRRPQRPLLTSSINGAGLALIALLVSDKIADPVLTQRLGYAVAVFAASALISYIAQRVKPLIVEIVSDLLFLIGAVIFLYAGLHFSGLITL